MSKTRLWHVAYCGDHLLVQPWTGHAAAKYVVRAISGRAAARRLVRGGTIADLIARAEGEWDNPNQPQHQDSPAQDRLLPRVVKKAKQLPIIVSKEPY